MNTKRLGSIVRLLCVILALETISPSAAAEVKAADLAPQNIIGVLGKVLGTKTEINGIGSNGMGPNFVVKAINGKPTTNFVAIYIESPTKVESGREYKFEGYETGRFVGVPSWTSENPKWLQEVYSYQASFMVTKLIEPAEKK